MALTEIFTEKHSEALELDSLWSEKGSSSCWRAHRVSNHSRPSMECQREASQGPEASVEGTCRNAVKVMSGSGVQETWPSGGYDAIATLALGDMTPAFCAACAERGTSKAKKIPG